MCFTLPHPFQPIFVAQLEESSLVKPVISSTHEATEQLAVIAESADMTTFWEAVSSILSNTRVFQVASSAYRTVNEKSFMITHSLRWLCFRGADWGSTQSLSLFALVFRRTLSGETVRPRVSVCVTGAEVQDNPYFCASRQRTSQMVDLIFLQHLVRLKPLSSRHIPMQH